MSKKIPVLLSVLALGLAVGCTQRTDKIDVSAPGFGEAVHHNMVMHIINPDPVPLAENSNGNRRALMMQRYETDMVEKPKENSTVGDVSQSGSDQQ